LVTERAAAVSRTLLAAKAASGARRVLADPLTHFVIVAAVLFGAYSLHRPEKPQIAVSLAIQQSLAKEYELLHGQPPDAHALAQLLESHVADEVLFREALAQGMHLNDAKTRERLVEKLRFSLTDTVADPTAEELVNFYADNLSLYYSEPKVSFDQVFYAKPPADPAEVLGRLRAGGQLTGDPFWLGSHFEGYAQSMLRGVLGQRFIAGLHSAPVGEWFGPIASARGTHFVRMQAVSAPALMPYTQVKDQVEDDWFAAKRASSVQAKIHEAEEKYDITIEH
jgi:peptidyl-prolyl cis-trans isomerase C